MLLSNLGKYRIIKWLGGGQFGDVYLAFDTILEKEFALKVARMRPEDILMLKDEARLLASLDHKNIVRFYNIDSIDGKFIMVIEYIKGASLRSLLTSGKFELIRAIKILTQCLEALEYAHNKNILHRDLKPENIILTESELVKIADFGLAKFIRPGTISASIAGTPIYMAPEAWRGTFRTQSDIYSLGAIFYEMLTAKPPFLAETLEQIRSLVLKKNPIAPSILNPSLPDWVEPIIIESLEKDPAKRIQSAREFLTRLNKVTKSIRVPPAALQLPTESKINLTSQQNEIINSDSNRILVLGGAGTGKTTTLIYKVYSTIKDNQIEPNSILISTFTKKAADDARIRLVRLLGREVRDLWLGTLHTICFRILKKEAQRLDFDDDFEILEKPGPVLKSLSPKFGYPKLRLITRQIENWKNNFVSPNSARKKSQSEWESICAEVYQKYQSHLKEKNLMDFDDLTYYTARLFEENPDLLKEYSSKFAWIFLDELQDFNPVQYKIIRMLSTNHNRIFLTGDEDQSIYEWRGAHPEYVLEATRDFPDIKTFVLTQNFRVPEGIWRLANNLISKNKGHKPKPIIILKDELQNVELFSGDNEQDEIYFLAKTIQRVIKTENKKFSDFAVLYRLNSQSKIYEQGFLNERIPYSLVGTEKFYEHEEVKYLIDFLKALQKRDLNLAIPTLAWALGKKIENFKLVNRRLQLKTSSKTQKAEKLLARVGFIFNDEIPVSVTEILNLILEQSQFSAQLSRDRSFSAQNTKRNIQELLRIAKGFAKNELDLLLNHLALLENLELVDWGKNTVKLMTVHSAKGLEFPVVFLVGMNEGFFPLLKNLNSPKTLAEERRLCFVALTRALERLYISYPKRLRFRPVEPSRFIPEMLGM
ncbi:MAG: UvrD-helicase domain-containing protein [bacterium]